MVLHGCSDFVMAYLDDIFIFSKNEVEHLKHIEISFQKLMVAGLKLKGSKCDFFKREILYLDLLILDRGIHLLLEKLDGIKNMSQPKNPKKIKQFLGLTGYYRKILPCFFRYFKAINKADGI